jgi:UDP-GlcNAc:undecaprenyl-phosphate GlcNAc-1-phosphate transferase
LTAAIGFISVFVITVLLTPALMRRASSWGLMALPDARRVHTGAIPVVGGIAMGLAFLCAWSAIGTLSSAAAELALSSAVALTLVGGVLDDRNELRASAKFAFQIAAAALLVAWGGTLLSHVGYLTGPELLTLGRWSVPLTIFAIVGVMNAINMLDGLDGLAASTVLCACFGFGIAAALAGNAALFAAICLIAGAVAGFLVFNARLPGRGAAPVYMGDTGSLLLGLLLAWVAISLTMGEQPAAAPITAVWILAVPIADTVTLMLRRALRGRSPFTADREHLHHILLAFGLTTNQTVVVIAGLSLAFGIIAITAQHAGVPEHVMFYAAMTISVAHGIAAEVLCRRLKLRA